MRLKLHSVRLDAAGAEVKFNLPLCPASVRVDLGSSSPGMPRRRSPALPATFALLGAGGPVAGSAVSLKNGSVLRFFPRDGVLAAGVYRLRLQGGRSGIRGLGGAELAAASITRKIVLREAPQRALALPSFARGPGQEVHVPAFATGLPLLLSDGSDVTELDVLLGYDPTAIDFVSADASLPAKLGVSLEAERVGAGRFRVALRAAGGLPPGPAVVVRLRARVPEAAAYGRARRIEILELAARSATGAALPVTGMDSLHVVGYLGDTSGNAGYSALDSQRALAFAAGARNRLPELPHLDPVLIADVTADGRVTRDDAEIIMRRAVGMPAAEIPALTGAVEPVFEGGPDPFVHIPKDLSGNPGESVGAPLMIDQASGLESLDMELAFDPETLEYQSTELGSLITNPQAIFLAHLSQAGDKVTLGVAIPVPLPKGGGELVLFEFDIAAEARGGATPLNIVFACLNEEGLTLTPAPDSDPDDPTDGVLTVVIGPAGTPFVRGDTNSDGEVNIADPIYVLNFLFGGGPGPICRKTADVNDDGAVNIADGIYELNFLFGGGPPPPPPRGGAPGDCGIDPTGDEVHCDSYVPCG